MADYIEILPKCRFMVICRPLTVDLIIIYVSP